MSDRADEANMKKPDRRRRVVLAFVDALAANDRARKHPPTEAQLSFASFAEEKHRANPNDLMVQLMPTDLREAFIVRDYGIASPRPRHFAYFANHVGMDVKEVSRERDRALARLEAAAHTLRPVEAALADDSMAELG
jgi:hypothetical protein